MYLECDCACNRFLNDCNDLYTALKEVKSRRAGVGINRLWSGSLRNVEPGNFEY